MYIFEYQYALRTKKKKMLKHSKEHDNERISTIFSNFSFLLFRHYIPISGPKTFQAAIYSSC